MADDEFNPNFLKTDSALFLIEGSILALTVAVFIITSFLLFIL